MKQESALDKRKKGKSITDSLAVIWLKDRLHPFMMLLSRTKVTYRVENVNSYVPVKGKPIIFAVNHSEFADGPVSQRATGRRSYFLCGKQPLKFEDWFFLVMTGTIWVDRKSKEDMAATKDAMIEYLKMGQSILWYPEGTWNLTANQLILPLKWGIIDIAKKANAQIIPMALDYNKVSRVCRVKFGVPMTGNALEDKSEAIRTLRDTMATLRWELMCDQTVLHRAQIDPENLKTEMERVLRKYPTLNWEYEQSCIYQPYESVEIVPKSIVPCRENAFLLRKI